MRFGWSRARGAAAFSALLTAHAWAGPTGRAQSAETEPEDIVVTAQRRDQNLQDTPISITALSERSLRERGVVDLSGVATATPNMQLTTAGNGSGGGNFAQVFIRGVGQPDFIITKDPGVGIYVDGVYLARAPGALLELLDIERIEVLRGPQGTLFGKNTEGGAISVITKRPRGELGGVAELRAGDHGRAELSGAFETPLVTDVLLLRASGIARHVDGYYERLLAEPVDARTADGNGVGVYSGRLSLDWIPSSDFEVRLAADGTSERQTATDYQAVGIFDSPNIELYNRVVGAPSGLIYDERYVAPRPWSTYSTSSSHNNSDIWGVSATASWDAGAVQFKSITAYRELDVRSKTDADGTPVPIVASDGIVVEQRQFSQELQVTGKAFADRFDWLVGLWYFQEHANDTQSSRQLVGLFEALEAAPPRSIAPPMQDPATCPPDGSGPETCLGGMGNPGNLRFDQTRLGKRTLDGRSYAGFVHGSFAITEQLGITAGLRVSREDKDFIYHETRPLQGNKVSFDNVPANPGWTVVTPKAGLEFRFSDALMAYASYARGFKAGGVNGRPARPDLFTSFDPEWVTTYEAGLKSDWFGGSLRINAALYFSQYSDIQITRNTVDADGAFIRLEDNAGDGVVRGFELEATWVPLRGLQLSGGVGMSAFDFTELLPQEAPPGTPLLTRGSELPFNPEITGTASLAYWLALGAAGQIGLRADVAGSSSYFIDIDNTAEVSQGAYFMFDARLAYASEDGHWEIFAAAKNLTDRAVVGSGVAARANGSYVVSYRPPRMLYAGVRFDFE
jgi:iron complex outermembrane recepter protein